ncbi:transketolase family protein [Candidatus Arthromitus sp. SFB-rat-Yit]|uniref:transketolase family protein n=1 Tax=Candidatus Arthromitus sp. SFB-rat-Yit TaxID=1041504 RepID=UPI000227A11F|nr:transketolase C-terminal domain-containing protein [Candidatus Arthromitus sp. SFB-rat-Yit]BAK81862.1 transketolase [Candidatus Arthromitus sp. SFB-rat-Yit]
MEMRQVLFNTMNEIMSENSNVVFMDADLAEANGTMKLREIYKDRAFDVGISEANMAGMAAGMSAYGMNPYICTFTPFASRRICDQIAISMCYAKQNVKIISTDSGVCAELNGGTHMSFEDIGVLRSIPGITIIDVVDEIQLREVLLNTVNKKGVIYIRIARKQIPKIYDDNYKFDINKADILKSGKDITIFTTGIMVNECIKASEILEKEGVSVELISVPVIKPIDIDTIKNSLLKTKKAVTVENHNIIGGLYSAICEISCRYSPALINSVGVNDHFGEVGSVNFLLDKYCMTSKTIIEKCRNLLK